MVLGGGDGKAMGVASSLQLQDSADLFHSGDLAPPSGVFILLFILQTLLLLFWIGRGQTDHLA